MKRKMLAAIIVVIVLGLALPVYNLLSPLTPTALARVKTGDAGADRALGILEEKCAICHTTPNVVLPFYASLPIAKQLMEYDVRTGTRHVSFSREFIPEEAGAPVSEATLAKVDYVIADGSMPPARYLILHWNHFLTEADKAALLAWTRQTRAAEHATPSLPESLRSEVLRPLPDRLPVDPVKAGLGGKLFHDKRLSKDNTIACASCHDLARGGTDQAQFATGVGGQKGDINSPTVLNAAFNFKQFWDGRAADLQAQADGPVNNPIEMASNWREATEKLSQDQEFTLAFLMAYPSGYNKENFTHAIAEFEKTLLTPTDYDRYLKGERNALNEAQKRGLQAFKQAGCANCHCGEALGGRSFEIMGLRGDYYAERGKGVSKPDYGRYNATGKEEDRFRLKTPVLRNAALTYPYFHDGTVMELEKAVDIMSRMQTAKPMTAAQVKDVVEFLKALTGQPGP